MSSFDIYVHGTPRGHQIWGSEHSQDYISTFYNHDAQSIDPAVLQIDVCGGDTFYTYLRHHNVYDVEGRPNAFFALTVGFRNSFCSNVYRLYQLFDAIYNQICVGSILKQSGNGENYLVSELTVARSGANATVEKIKAVFTQKIAELIVPTLQPLSCADTFNRSKKIVSLLEVDSPLFTDYIKKYSVIVSPNKQPSAVAYDAVSTELKQVLAQKKELSHSNERLQADIASLSQENKSLENQLHSSASSTEKKYKAKIEQLQSSVTNLTKERDSLKHKIEEAVSSIELMDQPFQKLTRLLAGRFPENRPQRREERLGDSQKGSSKNKKTVWKEGINSILLALVLVFCCVILVVVLKTKPSASETVVTPVEHAGNKVNQNVSEYIPEEETPTSYQDDNVVSYDSWEQCILNIKGGGENLNVDKEYTLSVTKNGKPANVPVGEWVVFVKEGVPINHGNTFTIKDQSAKGQNLMIQYIINGKPVKTRICKIQ